MVVFVSILAVIAVIAGGFSIYNRRSSAQLVTASMPTANMPQIQSANVPVKAKPSVNNSITRAIGMQLKKAAPEQKIKGHEADGISYVSAREALRQSQYTHPRHEDGGKRMKRSICHREYKLMLGAAM